MKEQLLGKTINNLSLSTCSQYLMFNTTHGDLYFYTENDCCNLVWINHINPTGYVMQNVVFELVTEDM